VDALGWSSSLASDACFANQQFLLFDFAGILKTIGFQIFLAAPVSLRMSRYGLLLY